MNLTASGKKLDFSCCCFWLDLLPSGQIVCLSYWWDPFHCDKSSASPAGLDVLNGGEQLLTLHSAVQYRAVSTLHSAPVEVCLPTWFLFSQDISVPTLWRQYFVKCWASSLRATSMSVTTVLAECMMCKYSGGPRIHPWGTPLLKMKANDVQHPRWTVNGPFKEN